MLRAKLDIVKQVIDTRKRIEEIKAAVAADERLKRAAVTKSEVETMTKMDRYGYQQK